MMSEAPWRPTEICSPVGSADDADRLRQRPHVAVVALHDRRVAVEDPGHARVGQLLDRGLDRVGVLAGQVAHVDVDHAQVGHLVERVAALDAAEVDRGAVEQVRGLARERQALDLAEDVDRLQDGVVADPGGRAVRGGACDLDAQHQHALGLDADQQVGRLAGDREVGRVAVLDEVVGAALGVLLGLLVADAEEVHAHGVLIGELADGAHDRGEPALHVVGAAADQPVAVDARRELLGAPGDHVEVAVQRDRRRALRADGRRQHRTTVVLGARHLHVARLEPALDEARGGLHPLEGATCRR